MEGNAKSDHADVQEANEILSAFRKGLVRLAELGEKTARDPNHPMYGASIFCAKDSQTICELMVGIRAHYNIIGEIPSDLFEKWRTLSKDQRAGYFFSMEKKIISSDKNNSTL